MKSVSIVVPIYNNWAGCHQLLMDIYSKNSLVEEVILVNDASPDKTVEDGIAWWKSTNMLPIELISLKENVGFSRASNIGLKAASEDVLCLISTDVRIYEDVVSYLHELSTSVFLGGRLLDWDTGWNTFDGRVYPYLEGWFLAAYKGTWKTVGYFDEQYSPYDMEDLDLSTQAVQLDYTLKVISDGYLSHVGGQSIGYGEHRETTTKINREKFIQKWIK